MAEKKTTKNNTKQVTKRTNTKQSKPKSSEAKTKSAVKKNVKNTKKSTSTKVETKDKQVKKQASKTKSISNRKKTNNSVKNIKEIKKDDAVYKENTNSKEVSKKKGFFSSLFDKGKDNIINYFYVLIVPIVKVTLDILKAKFNIINIVYVLLCAILLVIVMLVYFKLLYVPVSNLIKIIFNKAGYKINNKRLANTHFFVDLILTSGAFLILASLIWNNINPLYNNYIDPVLKKYRTEVLGKESFEITLATSESNNGELTDVVALTGASYKFANDTSGKRLFIFELNKGQTLGNVLDKVKFEIPNYYSTSKKYWGVTSVNCNDGSTFNSLDELKEHLFIDDTACSLYFSPDRLSPGSSIREINKPDGEPDFNYSLVSFYDYDGTLLKIQMLKNGETPTPPEAPTREGFVFDGWNQDYTKPSYNTALLASYKDEKTHCGVTFVLENPSLGVLENSYFKLEYGKTFKEQRALPVVLYPDGNQENWHISKILNANSNAELSVFEFGNITVKGQYTYIVCLEKGEGND